MKQLWSLLSNSKLSVTSWLHATASAGVIERYSDGQDAFVEYYDP
jgi:hypothetical protein